MNLTEIVIGAAIFPCIGVFSPIVIKAEKHYGAGRFQNNPNWKKLN